MTEKIKITPADTELLLQALYGSRQNYAVTPLGAGVWSYAYLFEQDGVKKVIRWGDVPDNFERDAYAAQFNAPGLPIPPILGMGEHSGKFYAISPYVRGGFLEQLSYENVKNTLPSILRMLRKLRSIEIPTTQEYGFFDKQGTGSHNSWKAFLLDDKNESKGSLIQGWKEILQASEMGMSAYDNLWNRFRSLIDFCPEDRRLVHSDMVNRNVLVEKGEIMAVLDWGSAFIGDPLYDIAWIKFCEPWTPYFKSAQVVESLIGDFRADPNVNKEHIDERLQCYLLNIGAGSLTYNAFRGDWKVAQDIVDYTNKLFA
jgi:hygromycin-B 4-O-kinase